MIPRTATASVNDIKQIVLDTDPGLCLRIETGEGRVSWKEGSRKRDMLTCCDEASLGTSTQERFYGHGRYGSLLRDMPLPADVCQWYD